MRTRMVVVAALLGMLASLTGCPKKKPLEYDRQLPPGQWALRKITDPAQIPDFTAACLNTTQLVQAIDNSLNYLAKPSSKKYFPMGDISHDHAVKSLMAFKDLMLSPMTATQRAQSVRDRYDVYESVGCDDAGTVLFTGYYTPIFDGSMEKTGVYQYPLYQQPEDLVKGPDGEILGRQTAGGAVQPYPAREEIERTGMLAGKELVWLKDPFEVYIAHVQGSAKIRLSDGRLITVGYAANNGHEYHSVGEALVAENRIDADQLSLAAMIEFFQKNPRELPNYTRTNPRFVFFRFEEGPPRGCLNEPVIPMRSLATDKTIFPRACLAYVTTQTPRFQGGSVEMRPFKSFMLDQDAGGAIRAPGRCDMYMGVGDEAGALAGRTRQEGRLYYLFLKK